MKHVQKTGAKAGQWVTCTTTPEKCRNGGSHLRDGDLFLARRLYEEQTGEKMPRIADVPESAARAFQALPSDKQQALAERVYGKQEDHLPKKPVPIASFDLGNVTLPVNLLDQITEISAKHGLKLTRKGDITQVGLFGARLENFRITGPQANLEAARPFLLAAINQTEELYAVKEARLDASIAALRKR